MRVSIKSFFSFTIARIAIERGRKEKATLVGVLCNKTVFRSLALFYGIRSREKQQTRIISWWRARNKNKKTETIGMIQVVALSVPAVHKEEYKHKSGHTLQSSRITSVPSEKCYTYIK